MSSHHRKCLPKSDKTKHPKLSSTVLDYYYKYGENRDLEKYLRFKRSTSKSSSDSSSRYNEYSNLRSDYERITKSMDKLHLPENPREKNIKSRGTKSTENISETTNQSQEKKPSNDDENRFKIEKKAKQTIQSKSKGKSYNLNLESSIELILPPSHSLPALSKEFSATSNQSPTKNVSLETTQTQTEEFSPMNRPNSFLNSSYTQTNATPSGLEHSSIEKPNPKKSVSIGKSRKDGELRVEESILETSPASSVASAKRLEWDSMADVGYNKFIDFKSQSNSNLSTSEKNALTKFFAKRGLNFDDNLVIISPCDKRSPLQKRKFTQSAVEMRETKKYTSETDKLSPATSKHLWERAIDKYREKYGKPKIAAAESTSGIDSMQFMTLSMAPHHSTPVAEVVNKRPVDSIISRKVLMQDKCENTDPERVEKACQTGGIQFETVGIQVDEQQKSTSRPVQTDIGNENSNQFFQKSIQIDDEDLTSATTSFEFLAPNLYKKCAMKCQITPIADVCNEFQQIVEIPHRDDTQNDESHLQISNPDEKENIPPIEDKENIPPPPLHTMHHDDQPSDYVTPDRSIDRSDMDKSALPTDLQKSVELINALIDSRKMDGETKKKLLRRIVRKIVKFKDTKEIAQMIMSYSDKSNSNAMNSSESSLEFNGSNETSATKTKSKKKEMSGVSTLSSTSDAVSDKRSVHENQNVSSPNIITISMKQEISGITTLSSSSHIAPQLIETKNEVNESEVKEWLLPVTQSEIERENSRRASNKSADVVIPPNEKANEHTKAVVNINEVESRPPSKPIRVTTSNEIFQFLENEKRTHFNWIDQEIEHLKNLKLLLQNIKANETDESKDVSEEKINSVYAKHNRDYLIIYENFKRSGKIEKHVPSDVDSFIDSTTSTDRSIARTKPNKPSKGHWMREPISESLISESSSEMRSQANHKDKYHEKMVARPPKDYHEWDSHINMQQSSKNRTKLKTPNSDDSIESYAKACRTKFDKKCSKNNEKSEYYEKAIRKIIDVNQPIYTKPYSSDSYSGIQRMSKADNNIKNDFKRTGIVDTYTSISGSDGFVSSNSISIGMVANSTSNTTTHQYDTKISVGIQTSNTLKRMQPIQLKKSSICVVEQPQIDPSTVRVNKLTINKNIQARPEALAYIIMFRDNPESTSNGKCKSSKSDLNKENVSNNNNQSSLRSNAANRMVTNKQLSNGDSLESLNSLSTDENLTLQEYLQAHRPDFMANAEQRRKCVNNLHDLRQQRNELRKQFFAMNTCLNAKTLNRNMKRLLPPQPLAQMRIFSTKEIVNRTRRKYQKLPEIRQRHQMERDMKIRRNQRMLVNVFSRKLQKHVLSGRTDLSNSMMVN